MKTRFLFAATILAGGLLASAAAIAQDGTEEVIVTAPRFQVEPGGRAQLPEKGSLSSNVRYDDLDLATYEGGRDLRLRVRDEARYVCRQLADAFPVYEIQ